MRIAAVSFLLLLNGTASADSPLSACDLLTNPSRFDGKAVQVRGVYAQYEHGAYLIPYPKCDTAEIRSARIKGTAGTTKAWSDAGGSKGYWMLATMDGRLAVSGRSAVFAIRSFADVQRVEPYELAK